MAFEHVQSATLTSGGTTTITFDYSTLGWSIWGATPYRYHKLHLALAGGATATLQEMGPLGVWRTISTGHLAAAIIEVDRGPMRAFRLVASGAGAHTVHIDSVAHPWERK